MKLAVIGAGPLGLHTALDYHLEGADVRLYSFNDFGGLIQPLAKHFPKDQICLSDYTDKKVLDFFDLTFDQEMINLELYHEKYLLKIAQFLHGAGVVKNHRVLRVQKRHLTKEESIPNHSRLYDLFRVYSELNPSGLVEKQIEENPELENKIGEDILNSLKKSVESFEDFDLVINCSGLGSNAFGLGGNNGLALNESSIRQRAPLFYSKEIFNKECLENMNSAKTISLVGSDIFSAYALCLLESRFEEPDFSVNIITAENVAYRSLLKSDQVPQFLKNKIKTIIYAQMEAWKKSCEDIESKIFQWRKLAVHERAKVSEPQFPRPKIGLYERFNVVSVDQLLDRQGTFLTIECPKWRAEPDTDIDKVHEQMKTIFQDCVIVGNGSANDSLAIYLNDDELGYFDLTKQQCLPSGLRAQELVKSRIFKFFSKV